ncbi:hypothetical protein [Clostridium perfringens]|uniref:hypothetical protein n=1 Tax=Clostridium perfringens TaxID=1502 RepID=UPI003CF8BE40
MFTLLEVTPINVFASNNVNINSDQEYMVYNYPGQGYYRVKKLIANDHSIGDIAYCLNKTKKLQMVLMLENIMKLLLLMIM